MHANVFDRFQAGDSAVHRLDPRVKVVVTVLFVLSNVLVPDGAWPAFALAFATPLARFFGTGPRGVASLFLFFLACGAIGNLGFGILHAGQSYGLLGASGGVSGLAAGAARIVGGEGGIGRLRSPFVLSMGGAWIVSNLLVALTGGALLSGGAQIAWEAHLAGFAAGLLLLRPFARLAGVR